MTAGLETMQRKQKIFFSFFFFFSFSFSFFFFGWFVKVPMALVSRGDGLSGVLDDVMTWYFALVNDI